MAESRNLSNQCPVFGLQKSPPWRARPLRGRIESVEVSQGEVLALGNHSEIYTRAQNIIRLPK